MFFLASTTDDRTRVCTATAAQAFGHLLSMTDGGLEPRVTDRNGNAISMARLRRLAYLDRSSRRDEPAVS